MKGDRVRCFMSGSKRKFAVADSLCAPCRWLGRQGQDSASGSRTVSPKLPAPGGRDTAGVMARKYIEEGWNGFAEAVLRDVAAPGSVQYTEMRRAFYAGATSVLSSIEQATKGTTDEEFHAVADAIEAELKEWAQRLERGEV